MDTSHLFSTPHPRLAPPSLAQQQGFQPGLSQVEIYTSHLQDYSKEKKKITLKVQIPICFFHLIADGSAADSYPYLRSTARSAAAPTHTSGSARTQHWPSSLSATGPVQLLSAALQVTHNTAGVQPYYIFQPYL